MAKISESFYAYLVSEQVIFRVPLNTSFNPEPELLYINLVNPLPEYMAVFSHNHVLYMGGGNSRRGFPYTCSNLVYMFDPTKGENIEQLPYSKFAPMVDPIVIRSDNGFYLLTVIDKFCKLDVRMPLRFQYFDPTLKKFETGPTPPPYPSDGQTYSSLLILHFCFFVRGYIYLSLSGNGIDGANTFKFNTKEVAPGWVEYNAMLGIFRQKKIVIPFGYFGNMGISDEFDDKTWILVAHSDANDHLIAYHVCLGDNGDIDPLSYRVLSECKMPRDDCDRTQLSDLGGGRFCVIRVADWVDFIVIYVFSIDFKREYDIQTSGSGGSSSDIIFSMKFNTFETYLGRQNYTGFCVVSAPPLACPGNEGQDRDDRKMKRRWGESSGIHYWDPLQEPLGVSFLLALVNFANSL